MASPTPEELQAQITALQQQMNQIIGMADDDFVLPWSGEEFEELLSGAGAASVRYDTTQSLTTTQQAQARSNINAAPGGYGWGDSANLSFATLEDFQTWFMANAAAKAARNAFAASVYIKSPMNDRMLMIASGDYAASGITILLYGYLGVNYQIRVDYKGVWTPIEYVNPPLALGVEYRTAERVAGKPVYTKLVDFGALPNATAKQVAFAASVGCKPIRVSAYVYQIDSTARYEVINGGCLPTSFGAPGSNDIWLTAFQSGSAVPQIYMYSSKNLSSRYAYAQVWYIKDSD